MTPAGDPGRPGWPARLRRAGARLAPLAGRAGELTRTAWRALRAVRLPGPVRGAARHAWRRKRAVALVLLLIALAPAGLLAAWSWRIVAGLSLERVQETSFLYGAGQALTAGLSVDAVDLAGTLRRLRYQEVTAEPRAAGQYRRTADAWEIFLNARSDPRAERAALKIRLPLDGPRLVGVLDPADGSSLDGIELEPEILSGLSDTAGQVRRPVRLAQVPRHLVAAVLATEDHRFYEHGGLDGKAVLRAVWVNLRRGEVAQGGSTLTQQLVKNLVLTPRRTWGRKLREAAVAVMLEWRYGKNDILEAYLNAIYLGQHGNVGLFGVGAAARGYFGKDIEKVSLGEAALLAGMIRAPNSYSPVQNAERARERRDLVLARMRDLGLIDEAARAKASGERVRVRSGTAPRLLGPYFLDHVRAQIEPSLADSGWQGGGLQIYTTLDPVLQRSAEAAITRGLDRLEGRYKHLRRPEGPQRLQAALIALDPVTGEIRALVGGRDYAQTQFNRAIQARRQPGSAFKPFVYLAALGYGPNGTRPPLTAVSFVKDEPLTMRVGRDTWAPRNYEDRFEGTVTVRRAIEQSLNAATVRVAEAVGFEAVVRTARQVGFTSPMQPVPALALGSFEVTPLELAAAYATLANDGQRLTPLTVRAIAERDGTLRDQPAAERTAAVHPGEAFLVTYLLRGVVDRGTGVAARAMGVEGTVAGKTGTTNDGRDAWFVGYTPRLVTLVWVGFDERDVLRLSGSQAALPIWADFMRAAMVALPPAAFTVPTSIVLRDVDPTNGKLATRYCPVVFREAFLSGTEPRETCTDHGGPLQLFDSLFQRFLDALRPGPSSDR